MLRDFRKAYGYSQVLCGPTHGLLRPCAMSVQWLTGACDGGLRTSVRAMSGLRGDQREPDDARGSKPPDRVGIGASQAPNVQGAKPAPQVHAPPKGGHW